MSGLNHGQMYVYVYMYMYDGQSKYSPIAMK